MLSRIFCCFAKKSEPIHKAMYSVCVDTPPITLFDTKPVYEMVGWNDTIQFVPPISGGIVIKVYDGDTITIASRLPYADSPLYRFSVRLNGIDCPEMKSRDDSEKECAVLAKKAVSDLVMNKTIILKNVQTEKYGRLLADVYINDLHLNAYLIEKRLAVKYDGATKVVPTNWMEYHLKG